MRAVEKREGKHPLGKPFGAHKGLKFLPTLSPSAINHTNEHFPFPVDHLPFWYLSVKASRKFVTAEWASFSKLFFLP
jgi:hypothetical protein